jgi:hypothetical protein
MNANTLLIAMAVSLLALVTALVRGPRQTDI